MANGSVHPGGPWFGTVMVPTGRPLSYGYDVPLLPRHGYDGHGNRRSNSPGMPAGILARTVCPNTQVTGLDYFGTRYSSRVQVRFTTPSSDSARSHLDDPQNWNAYNFAGNNPPRFMDPNGLNYRVYDTLGRVKWVTGDGGAVNCSTSSGLAGSYIQAASYSYTGNDFRSAWTLGNNLVETRVENLRGQVSEIQLGSLWRLVNAYGGTNNGNVESQTLTVGGGPPITTSYSYDSLNRLVGAGEAANAPNPGWTESYGYDRYGNRWLSGRVGLPEAAEGDVPRTQGRYGSAPNNRVDKDTIAGKYDAAGRLLVWSGQAIGYDGEDRMVTAGGITFGYDGEGRRVKKMAGAATTYYVYDGFGQLAAEYSTVAAAESGTRYLTADQLGSTRAVTKAGSAPRLSECLDYRPFGELIPGTANGRGAAACYGAASELTVKFTGKEREVIGLDDSSGLDYFGARYFAGAQGRFTSPDPIVVTPARMVDPQRFNLYVYARNNPLTFVDLDGRDVYLANDSEEERRKALYSITKNLSTREQRNIGYRQNAQGKYELYIKDASKVNLSKASEGYQQLANRIGNHDLQINFTLIPTGGAATDPNGNSLSHSTLSGWSGSGGLTYYTPGTGNADVFVAEGGKPTGIAGLTASGRDVGILFPEYIITAHELFGETLKLTPGNTWLQLNPVQDSVAAVEVENRVRTFHGLPQRSGKDHANYPIVQSITVGP